LKWGKDGANHINGEFAAVIINEQKNEVFIFRDHIGARPLTYTFDGKRLIFSSSQYAIAKSGLIKVQESAAYKTLKKQFGKKNYPLTYFDNVYKVKSGHLLAISMSGLQEYRYWNPEKIKINHSLSFEESATTLQKLMIEATINRMDKRKIGVHVSGGLDCTGVASILADNIDDKSTLIGYSWSPEIEDLPDDIVIPENEKIYIDHFSAEKNVKVRYYKSALPYNEAAFWPEFETMHIEHQVMKQAIDDEVGSIFTGWGGDEVVSLSIRGVVNHLVLRLKIISLFRLIKKRGIKFFVKRVLEEVFLPIFSVKKKNIYGWGGRYELVVNLLNNRHLTDRIDSWGYFAEKYGFSYKYPLTDKAVIEFYLSVPEEHTYHNMESRILYKEAMKGILPEKIRTRINKWEYLRIASTRHQSQKEGEVIKEKVKESWGYDADSASDARIYLKEKVLHEKYFGG